MNTVKFVINGVVDQIFELNSSQVISDFRSYLDYFLSELESERADLNTLLSDKLNSAIAACINKGGYLVATALPVVKQNSIFFDSDYSELMMIIPPEVDRVDIDAYGQSLKVEIPNPNDPENPGQKIRDYHILHLPLNSTNSLATNKQFYLADVNAMEYKSILNNSVFKVCNTEQVNQFPRNIYGKDSYLGLSLPMNSEELKLELDIFTKYTCNEIE